MTALVWDEIGERVYQTGVDRGVLYIQDSPGVAWNGLTSVEESSVSELKSYYLEGKKFLETLTPANFQAKLKAFTYPDEFDLVNGVVNVLPGMSLYEQPYKSFGLSYRTKIGNDIEGLNYGYKIHILYNVIANPDSHSFNTLKESDVQPAEFSWTLTGTPPHINKHRPTVHVSIDSRITPSNILTLLENTLYGTESSSASLPTIQEIADIFGFIGALIIVDHGDGTWSAIDEGDNYIAMLDSTTFQISDADATYLDSDSYTISSTNVGGEL